MYGPELAARVARGLQTFYLAGISVGPNGLGLWCDRLSDRYFVQPFTDGEPSGSPVLELQGQEAFIAWLARQSDESLARLAPDTTGPGLLSSRGLETFVSDIDSRATGLYRGQFQLEHPMGGNYSISPAYVACQRGDLEMLKRAIAVTTQEERQNAVDGKNALGVACEKGFVEGADLLLREDGYCCRLDTYCSCLLQAATAASPCLALFRGRGFGEREFLRAIPYWIPAPLRRKALDVLGIRHWLLPVYLIDRIRREERYGYGDTLEKDIAEELAVFPELDLDGPSEVGERVLISYLSTSRFQHSTFLRLRDAGAYLQVTTPEGVTALDVLLRDGRELSPDQRLTLHALVDAGVRTSVAGPLTRLRLGWGRLLRRILAT